MKNLKRSVVAMLLIITLVLSLVVPSAAATSEPTTYSKQYNSGQRDVICTTLNGTSAASYYTGSYTYDNLSSLSSTALYTSLQTLMRKQTYTSSYDDCHYKSNRTDCENEDGSVSLIYTSYSATMSQWNGWNREHVWPKSLGGDSTTGGGADLHHIRPSDAVVNSTRSNRKYGNVNGGTAVYGSNPASGVLGGYRGSGNDGYYEPLDNVKGDVARICLYVYVRWGSAWGATSITKVFESVDVLLEWCELDPVDTWEMGRNEVVQNIQGNRNVFIDYPELAWLLFDEEIPEDMQTPSGEAMDGACPHENTEIRGKADATCTTDGNTGDVYCKDCGRTITKGDVIIASHSWSEWQINEADDTKTRACSVCGTTQSECQHSDTEIRNKTEATCTTMGYTGDTYCKSCGEKLSSGSSKPSNGHSWGAWQIGETEKTRTCGSCGATQTQAIDAPECLHTSTEQRDTVAATCGSAGYSGDTYCKDCDEKLSKGKTIPATANHSWSELTVTVEPTETSKGEGVCTCTVCGVRKTVTVDYEAPEADTTVEQTIIAIITKNAFDALLAGYLAGA